MMLIWGPEVDRLMKSIEELSDKVDSCQQMCEAALECTKEVVTLYEIEHDIPG